MAVATNAPRAFADACLHHIGLASAMSAVVSCDDVSLPKPAPDVYLRAADLLGLPPQRCVAIEDSDVGLRAARTAGLVTIGVGPAVVGVRGVAHHVGTIEGLAELRALRGSRTG
jgi:HAD superfamily hydrolase (TIGR01509 family)